MKYIKSVSIKNFFSYGPQETVIDLSGNGITNISGCNGIGKSTLIEAKRASKHSFKTLRDRTTAIR